MRILVTAGPTCEYLDDVRFLSNPSSGRMGFCVAGAAAQAGHEVILVSGPVSLADPPGCRMVRVTSAGEMACECFSHFADCDAVVMTAAVCDYRPKDRLPGKLKKGSAGLVLELERTPDILEELGKRKTTQKLVGFALEVQDALENATGKLARKNLDYIVLNSPETFGSERISCEIIGPQGSAGRFESITKQSLARKIIRLLEEGGGGTS
jgi:phosphopantothenoylcysteine decarboxylase/phosphopantothenate--cysteine ligase